MPDGMVEPEDIVSCRSEMSPSCTQLSPCVPIRTSAALAAAAPGADDSFGACSFLPNVRPPCGALILGGAAAVALFD